MISLRTLLGIVLVLSISHQSLADPMDVGIVASATSGKAPFTVHVKIAGLNDSSGTPLGAGNWLTARYQWEFLDSPGVPSVGDHSILPGWNAAHTFETAGVKTIMLKVWNENGEYDEATIEVTVAANNRIPIYVAANGNDSSKNPHNPSFPIKTFYKVVQMLNASPPEGYHVFFRRGDTFSSPQNQGYLISASNWIADAYTDPAQPTTDPPIIRRTSGFSSGAQIFRLAENDDYQDVIIQNLHMDSSFGPEDPDNEVCAAVGRGHYSNVTIRKCSFENISTVIYTNSSGIASGVYTYDNVCGDLGTYYVWLSGPDHVHVNNSVTNSLVEHNIRIDNGYGHTRRCLIAFNNLSNDVKKTIWFRNVSFGYITGNTCHLGRVELGPDHAGGIGARTRWCVFERNFIDRRDVDTSEENTLSLIVAHGAEHTMIRNNIIEAPAYPTMRVNGYNATYDRTSVDTRILHNTTLLPGAGESFATVAEGAAEVQIANNLFIAPNLEPDNDVRAIVHVTEPSPPTLEAFTTISDNVWQHYDGYEDPFWVTYYMDLTDWLTFAKVSGDVYHYLIPDDLDSEYRPPFWSAANDHYRAVAGVWEDYGGSARPATDTWTAGAVEIPRCREDLDGLNGVGQQDLNAVLNRWGDSACLPGGASFPCPEDIDRLNGNGVDQQDLNAVLNRWGDPICNVGSGFAGGGGMGAPEGMSGGGAGGGLPNLLAEFGITDAAWTASLTMLNSDDEAVRDCWWCWFIHYMLPAPDENEMAPACECENPFIGD